MQMDDLNNQTVKGYDKTVAKYIDTSPQKVNGQLKAWINKNLKQIDKTAKILEIGSGSGKDAAYFESLGYRMELSDASQGFVDYLIKNGKSARLFNAITDELDGDYDMVFADAVFLHFNPEQLEKVLRKIFKALKPKGLIVFSLKAGNGEEVTDRKLGVNRYFCYWQADDIKKLLLKNGFTNIEIQTIDDYRGKDRPDWLLVNANRDKNDV
jgi:SAM-dependent methyltransferase